MIPGTHDLALFIVSGLLLNIAPGPDSLLIITRSASQGWRAGTAAALGIGTGTFVHVFAAALGLSAVLATSATAFSVVKYVGAAYLLYIGIGMLIGRRAARDAPTQAVDSKVAAPKLRKIFAQGFLTNVLNPKVAIFFLAFVPQFIDAGSTNKPLAFIALGAIFDVNSMLWSQVLIVTAAFAGQRIRMGGGAVRWLNRAIGAMFVSFGLKLALTRS